MSGISAGPLFRRVDRWDQLQPGRLSDRAVSRAIARAARRAGLPGGAWSGHSLRSGFATAAAAAGVPERLIEKQTGHRSLRGLGGDIREEELFSENAAGMVGL